MSARTVLVTGATGLLGAETLRRLLLGAPGVRAYVLVRDVRAWTHHARRPGSGLQRVVPVRGDLTLPGVGLEPGAERILREIDTILHLAADTSFGRSLPESRRTNVEGTRNLLELAAAAPRPVRFVFVSTAFVAGRLTGRVPETPHAGAAGWLNAYEQSKHEAEALVRERAAEWLILRPSTVVCDDPSGSVTQVNAVHRGMHVYYRGLAAMMPGSEETPVDMVPRDYVCEGISRLALAADVSGRTLHLCAGGDALPLGEVLDRAFALWERIPEWRRRCTSRPVLADLPTYRLFERSIEETGDARLRRVIRSVSFFMPQLAFPKVFDTSGADSVLGFRPPPVRSFWTQVLEHLLLTQWRAFPPEPSPDLEEVA